MSERRWHLLLFCFAYFPYLVNGIVNTRLAATPCVFWVFDAITWIVVPAIAFYLLSKRPEVSLASIGLTTFVIDRRSYIGIASLAFVLSFLFLAVTTISERYSQIAFPAEPWFRYSWMIPESAMGQTIVATYYAITSGLVEEVLYRGYLFRISQYFTYPKAGFLCLGPVLFALAHWEGGVSAIVSAYILGLVASLVYLVLKNVWPLAIGHGVTNYVLYS